MLRLIYKTIMVSMLSMTLLLPSVFASDEASSDSASDSTSEGEASPQTPTDDMLSSIGMLSVGIITTHLTGYKPSMTADMDLAASGGQSYVAAEVSSTGEFKILEANLQLEVAKLSEGKQSEAQAHLKNSYSEAKEILERKLMLQKVAAEAFASAAVAAYKMKDTESSANPEVATIYSPAPAPKITFASKALSLAISPVAAGEAENKLLKTPQFDKCTKKLKAIGEGGLSSQAVDKCGMFAANDLKKQADVAIAAVLKLVAARDLDQSSVENKKQADDARIKLETEVGKVQVIKEKLKAKNPECAALINDVKQECTEFGKLLADHEAFKSAVIQGLFSSIPVPQINSNYVEKLLNLAMPTAEAGSMLSLFGLGEVDTAIVMGMTPELAKEVDRYLFSPGKRAKVWGVLEGRANKAAAATQLEIDKIDNSIEKMGGLLDGVVKTEKRNLFESILDMFFSKVTAETNKFSPTTATKNLAFGAKLPCALGGGNTNCASLTTHLRSAAGFSYLPPLFQNVVKQITDFSDQLSGASSISPKMMSDANNIASKHTAIAGLLKQYQNKQDIKTQNILSNKLNSITANVLRKKNVSPAGFLAHYGGTSLVKTDANTSPAKVAQRKTAPLTATTVQPALKGGAANVAAVAPKKVPEKNYKVNDINRNKVESIFTVISNRYLKSAFHKFFEQ